MSRLFVGLHCLAHDASICFYDSYIDKFLYIKFERLNNIKHYPANNFIEWIDILSYYGYTPQDIKAVCTSHHFSDDYFKMDKRGSNFEEHKINHHFAHLLSQQTTSGIVYDGEGSESESLSVFQNKIRKITYHNDSHYSLGLIYNQTYFDRCGKDHDVFYSFQNSIPRQTDAAGKVMAWEAYGEHLSKFQRLYKDLGLKDIKKWGNIDSFYDLVHFFTDETDTFKLDASFIKNITTKTINELQVMLKLIFNRSDCFSFSGGVAQNLIINNSLKSQFPNLVINAHNQDDGLSIGCLQYLLDEYKINKKVSLENYPFSQADEDMGYAKINTIRKIAEYLAQGKIVLWCQGNGEIGPRALGHRSVLMNPGISNAKEQVNNRVKKREWYRPYAASVTLNKYQEYFDLPWESPYMLYQAKVKDPVKFQSITHADGTCRIQTVNPTQFSFHELLEEFQKLTGYPILLNTSLNLPGSPIVGRKKIALDMFKNSQADYLVIGDTIHERNHND
tara:strand:+ start:2270 stop:3781 length:1512 start_codon:yes stop_codon:yes gene_type:complete